MDIQSLVKDVGPWAAIAVFMIWWAWKREVFATNAHRELEAKVMDRVLQVLMDNTRALSEHAASLRNLNTTVGRLDETMRKVDSDSIALAQSIQTCAQCKSRIIIHGKDTPSEH